MIESVSGIKEVLFVQGAQALADVKSLILNLGVSFLTSTYELLFSGNNAWKIGIKFCNVPDSDGKDLRTFAGGATQGSTDKNGGTLILTGGISTGQGSSGVKMQGNVGFSGFADMVEVSGYKVGFFGVTPMPQPLALPAPLSVLESMALLSGGFGFSSAADGQQVLAAVGNLQHRLVDLEDKLCSLGLIAPPTG